MTSLRVKVTTTYRNRLRCQERTSRTAQVERGYSFELTLRPAKSPLMSASCCNDRHRGNPSYRRVLWSVLAINAAMFLVEIGARLKMLVLHDDAVCEYARGVFEDEKVLILHGRHGLLTWTAVVAKDTGHSLALHRLRGTHK